MIVSLEKYQDRLCGRVLLRRRGHGNGQVRGYLRALAGRSDRLLGRVRLVREQIGPVAALKTVLVVPPAPIDDPVALDEITGALNARGLGI